MRYSFYLKLEGLNIDRLLKNITDKNIKIYNLIRQNYKTCLFGLSFFNYYKIKKLNLLKPYKVTIVKTSGFGFLFNNFFKNFGLYFGVLCVAIFMFIICKTTLKINVLGVENITEAEVIGFLNEIGVKTGKINIKTNDEIEQYLKQADDRISLVSVSKKGTNLLVNIKEKILKSEEIVSPICAEYNMVINSVSVLQGVAKVKVGDVVKKGDILVEPKIVLTNGEANYLKPVATINATVWITGQVIFKTEDVIYEKTGKKQVVSTFDFMGMQLFPSYNQVKFENYEKIVYNNYVFKNMFLPLKLNKTIYYETKEKFVKYNFDDYKEKLVSNSKNIAYSKLPKTLTVENEMVNISQNGNLYYITTYLQTNLKIEG